MGKVAHRIPLPTSESHTFFIGGDLHGEHLDIPTFTKMIQLAQSVPNKSFIINGDLYDASYAFKKEELFKHWKKIKTCAEDFFIPEFDKETKLVNDILDGLQTIFPKVYFVGGNHDEPRMNNIIEAVPHAYKGYFNIQEKLHLKKRNIPFIPHNDWLDIGHHFFSITHGIAHGATAHKKHYLDNPVNVIFSHIHSSHSIPFQSRGSTKRVVSAPTMAGLNPDYMKNNDSNWENGFITLTVTPDPEVYSLNVHIVRNGKLVLMDGRVI